MRIGLDISLRRYGGALAFNPATLFVGGVQGAWYDPSDLSSMWQDSAGTVPAAVNSPVGKLDDKSGRGNHATQATTAAKPTLRQAGSVFYLEFDGVDDVIANTRSAIQPWDRVSALRQVAWVTGNRIYGDAALTASGLLFQTGVTPQIALFDGTVAATNGGLAVGVNGVVTERHSGVSSRLAINNTAYTTGDSGITNTTTLRIGSADTFGFTSMHSHGIVQINRALTDPEIADLRAYLATKAGVTL